MYAMYNCYKTNQGKVKMDVKSEVMKALDQYAVKGGKEPTLRSLRSLIGSGSFTTISDAVKEWKAQQLPAIPELPDAMPEEAARIVCATVWRSVAPLLKQRIDEVRQDAEARIKIERETTARLQAVADETLSDATAKEEALKQAQQRAETLDKELQEIRGELRELRAAKAALEERNEALQNELGKARQEAVAAQAEAAAIRKMVPLLDPKHVGGKRSAASRKG